MKTIDIVMIPVSLAVIAVWLYSIIGGIKAARRKGISPHWMWFGVHPVTGLIAFVIIRWWVANRTGASEAGSETTLSSALNCGGLNSDEHIICHSSWATRGPDFLFRLPCIVRITNQRLVIHYSYFDCLNSGLLTMVGWHVAACAAYRALTNKPKYSTVPFEAIEIVSVHKKLLFHVFKICIKSSKVRERGFALGLEPEAQSKVTIALKPADADRLLSAMPSFSREGSLGPISPGRPTPCATPVPSPESVPPTSFYYKSNGVVVGPLDTHQLRQHAKRGLLKPDAVMKKGEDGKWVLASQVKGLFGNTEK